MQQRDGGLRHHSFNRRCRRSGSNGHSTSAPTASSATSSVPTNASSTSTAGGGSAAGSGFCKVAAVADAAQRKAASSLAVDSPAALQKFEAQSLAKLQQFVAIAPTAIKGDLEVIVAADRQLYNALAAAHFDMRSMNTATLAKLDTPQFKRRSARSRPTWLRRAESRRVADRGASTASGVESYVPLALHADTRLVSPPVKVESIRSARVF